MTFWRLVLNNLSFHRRMHVAVALGVAAAVAVLTGALVVGDSVRGTLRDVALERLGCYDEALVTDRFFRTALAQELAATPGFEQHFSDAVPAIIVRGTVEYHRPDGRTARASRVTIIGCNRYFWPACRRDPAEMVPRIAGDQIAINAALAGPEQLGIDVSRAPGAEVLLRIGAESHIPADSPLGRKQGTVRSRTLAVGFVVPSRVLGNFSLRPNQQTPLCAFVDLATLQSLLDRPQRANAILVAGRVDARSTSQREWSAASESANQWLASHLHPTAADYGLTLNHVVVGDRAKPVLDYYNLTSDRMLLDRPVDKLADAYGDRVQPALTYLANDLQCGERHVPYSTITAIDPKKGFGPFQLGDALPSPDPSLKGRGVSEATPSVSKLADDEIILTDWAADYLQAKPGDTIRVTYFDPETTHGEAHERVANFKLRAIVPLAAPNKPPLPTNDPDLAPPLAGVTDRKSITTWDPPFPFHPDRVRPRDERYWLDHRTTPKAYVSLSTGRRLWGSRFGQTTSLRFSGVAGATPQPPSDHFDVSSIAPPDLGFMFQPVKQQALQAAAGTTPFDVLFLSFSAFLIAAALMLLAVLFRLGVERRASQIGLLMAVGLSRRKIARLLATEGAMVAAVGGLVGILLGIGYAWLLLAGLRSWWISAVSTPLLTLHVEWKGLAIGYLVGVGVCIAAIVLTLRSIRKVGARSLLHGEFSVAPAQTGVSGKRLGVVRIVAILLLGVALLLAVVAGRFEGEAQTGVFFGSGALTLTAALVAAWSFLRAPRSFDGSAARLSLGWLARRNAARNPGRSALAIGLTAIATFLIVATSAFRLDVSPSGSGGFNLLAESSAPVHRDLNTPAGRFELGITGPDETQLAASTVAALRVHDGDDASCQNLYRPGQPRILGVPPTLAELCRGSNRFEWGAVAQSAALTRHDRSVKDIKDEDDSPWRLLDEPVSGNPSAIPVILDENTARYSLNLWGGVGDTVKIRDSQGREVTLSVVGLLKNSIFQGSLLVGERQLLKLFPDTSGYRYFLIRTLADQAAAVRGVLEDRLGDYGFAVTPASRRLAELFAVQNTYIGAFQSLGGLGLLLGTFGLAAVQLRSVLERRGELALLRAVGFSRRRLVALVLAEHRLLLIGGLAIGLGAALLAVWPHLAGGRARIPWESLAITLAAVLALGLAAGWLAVRATLRAPLVPALRSE